MQTTEPIVLVGFEEATITQEFYNLISQVSPVEILHPDDLLAGRRFDGNFLISVTKDINLRKKLSRYLDQHLLSRATFVHHSAVIDKNATILGGTFICPFASVYNNAVVGKDCILGPYSMVSHRTELGQGSILHPGAMIAGSTKVGTYCLFGIRSTMLDKIDICDDTVIGANSLVTKSITKPGHYVGSPARKSG